MQWILDFFEPKNVALSVYGRIKMNSKSDDETYNKLIDGLRSALKTLAQKIEPKVYEYGFLKQ
jgi:hypothetical protein